MNRRYCSYAVADIYIAKPDMAHEVRNPWVSECLLLPTGVINKIKVNRFGDVGAVCRKPERAPRMADAAPSDIEQRL